MNQYAVRTIGFAGLSVATFVLSFFGCNQDYGDLKGNCQVADAGPDDCIIPKCNADGTPAPVPVPNAEKKVCFRGENEGVCVDGDCALTCEAQMVPCKCDSDSACPDDKQCIDWACIAGACISTVIKEGELVDPLETADCKKSVCQSGKPQTVEDLTDKPADVPKDCNQPACMGMTPGKEPDTADVPDATGCTSFMCGADGMIMSTNAEVGTPCATGACDSAGMCVDCLPKAEWDTCKLNNAPNQCPVSKCDAQPCTANNECKTACADGVCCNTTCTDECKSCNVMSMNGTCSNIPFYDDDPSYTDPVFMMPTSCTPASGATCNGTGKCLKTIGKACTLDSDCLSGKCAMPAKVCLGAKGEPCATNSSCASNVCNAMGICE